jgi:Fe2+ transport system protein FeoA
VKLGDIQIGKKSIVKNIDFCNDCPLTNDECMILSLMEKGLVPGSELIILSNKLGMYELSIDGTHLILREESAKSFNIELEI